MSRTEMGVDRGMSAVVSWLRQMTASPATACLLAALLTVVKADAALASDPAGVVVAPQTARGVQGISFRPEHAQIVTVDEWGRSITVWDVRDDSLVARRSMRFEDEVQAIRHDLSGEHLGIAGEDRFVVADGGAKGVLASNDSPRWPSLAEAQPRLVAPSADGRGFWVVGLAGVAGEWIIWIEEFETGTASSNALRSHVIATEGRPQELGLSRDADRVHFAAFEGTEVRLMEIDLPAGSATDDGPARDVGASVVAAYERTRWVRNVAISPEGRYLAACEDDEGVVLLERGTRRPKRLASDSCYGLAFTGDGRSLFTSAGDVFSLPEGKRSRSFSPDWRAEWEGGDWIPWGAAASRRDGSLIAVVWYEMHWHDSSSGREFSNIYLTRTEASEPAVRWRERVGAEVADFRFLENGRLRVATVVEGWRSPAELRVEGSEPNHSLDELALWSIEGGRAKIESTVGGVQIRTGPFRPTSCSSREGEGCVASVRRGAEWAMLWIREDEPVAELHGRYWQEGGANHRDVRYSEALGWSTHVFLDAEGRVATERDGRVPSPTHYELVDVVEDRTTRRGPVDEKTRKYSLMYRSPSHRYQFSSTNRYVVRQDGPDIFDVEGDEIVLELEEGTSVSFSADDTYAALFKKEPGSLEIVELGSNRQVARRPVVSSFGSFSNDNRLFAFGDYRGIAVWDWQNDELVLAEVDGGRPRFSPDDRFLAVGNVNTITIWDLVSAGKAAAFSLFHDPDGERYHWLATTDDGYHDYGTEGDDSTSSDDGLADGWVALFQDGDYVESPGDANLGYRNPGVIQRRLSGLICDPPAYLKIDASFSEESGDGILEPTERAHLLIDAENLGQGAARALGVSVDIERGPATGVSVQTSAVHEELEPGQRTTLRIPMSIDHAAGPGEVRLLLSMSDSCECPGTDVALTVPVRPLLAPDLSASLLRLDDDIRAPSAGNGNGVVEAREYVQLFVEVRNSGPGVAKDVEVALASRSVGLAIVNGGPTTYPSIEAGGAVIVEFLVKADRSLSEGERLDLSVSMVERRETLSRESGFAVVSGQPFVPEVKTLICTPGPDVEPRSTDWAVVIAAQGYDDSIGEAPSTERDAAVISECLVSRFGVPRDHVVRITGSRAASRAAIEGALLDLRGRALDPEDSRVYFYFSGHGTVLDEGPERGTRSYLVPTDATRSAVDAVHLDIEEKIAVWERNLISREQLLASLEPLDAQLKVVMLDSCYMAPLGRPLVPRHAVENPSRRVVWLVASDPQRTAKVDPNTGLGVFTGALVRAVNSYPATREGLSLADFVDQVLVEYGRPALQDDTWPLIFGSEIPPERARGLILLP